MPIIIPDQCRVDDFVITYVCFCVFVSVCVWFIYVRYSPTLLYFPLHPGWRWAESLPVRCRVQPEGDLGKQSWLAALEPCTGLHPPPAGRSLPGRELRTAERACRHRGLSHTPGLLEKSTEASHTCPPKTKARDLLTWARAAMTTLVST